MLQDRASLITVSFAVALCLVLVCCVANAEKVFLIPDGDYAWGENQSEYWAVYEQHGNVTETIHQGTVTELVYPLYDGKQWYVPIICQGYYTRNQSGFETDRNMTILMTQGDKVWYEEQDRDIGQWVERPSWLPIQSAKQKYRPVGR